MHQVNGEWIRINWGDKITYKRAFVTSAYAREAKDQLEENGPYEGVCVSCEDNTIQVRADGWMGQAPLMIVWPSDIISVESRQS